MNIKIYTLPTCPWCTKTKGFFKLHKLKYEEFDVSNNKNAAKEMIKKSGQNGVPVTVINGKIIIGFDKENLKKALKL